MVFIHVAAIIVAGGVCPTDRSEPAAWGNPSHGLQCRASGPAKIEQCMHLEMGIELRAVPKELPPGTKKADLFIVHSSLTTVLRSVATGKEFTVQPYVETRGPAVFDDGKHHIVPLDGTAIAPWRTSFPLLRLGDALEPGVYECRVEYTFPGRHTAQWWHGSQTDWHSLWKGTAASAPQRIEILKATPKTATYLLPKRLRLAKGLEIVYTKEDAEEVKVTLRNGHFVFTSILHDHIGSLGGGVIKPDDVNAIDHVYEYGGGPWTRLYAIEVFETSDPSPEGFQLGPSWPGYRTLWKRSFRLSFSEAEMRKSGPPRVGGLAPEKEPILTRLSLAKTHFRSDEPILVDVFVENQTKGSLERRQFSPLNSIIRGPELVLARVPGGKEFAIPTGLYGDDWGKWYQPASGKGAFAIGKFVLPPGKNIPLLHGDLRLTLLRARDHCKRALGEKTLLERPDNANTKRSYEEIVRFVDEFLKGGAFDLYVRAYSQTQTVRITIDHGSVGNPPEYIDWGRVAANVSADSHARDSQGAGGAGREVGSGAVAQGGVGFCASLAVGTDPPRYLAICDGRGQCSWWHCLGRRHRLGERSGKDNDRNETHAGDCGTANRGYARRRILRPGRPR